MTKTRRIQLAYNFFYTAEEEHRSFSLDEVVKQTGWRLSTVYAYRTKKWYPFMLDDGNGLFRCKGIINFPLQSFIKLHEQHTEIYSEMYRPRYGDMADILLDKSREAAMLAIQTYNNPTVTFRTEGFIVNMIIAFTALFHAIFEKDKIAYWYIDNNTGQPLVVDGSDKKYWELSECLKQYYQDNNSPEKANLSLCILIRNKIEHRFYNTLDLNLSGYCQSLLMNYEKLLTSKFGEYFSLGSNHLALALQITTYEKAQIEALNSIQSHHYEEIQSYINDFCQQLPNDILGSERFQFRAFMIPIIGNHESSSNISIEWVNYDPNSPEQMDKYNTVIGLIREKIIQVANQGKYLPSDVVKQIQDKGIAFNMSMHTKAWKLYKVRPKDKSPHGCNTKYCQFNEPYKNFIYTKEWIDYLTMKLKDCDEYDRIKSFRVR
jgi:hypothetical protein